jgi:hypothetical protein
MKALLAEEGAEGCGLKNGEASAGCGGMANGLKLNCWLHVGIVGFYVNTSLFRGVTGIVKRFSEVSTALPCQRYLAETA